MNNFQLIDSLCGLIEQLIILVRDLASQLAQVNALDEAMMNRIDSTINNYDKIME